LQTPLTLQRCHHGAPGRTDFDDYADALSRAAIVRTTTAPAGPGMRAPERLDFAGEWR